MFANFCVLGPISKIQSVTTLSIVGVRGSSLDNRVLLTIPFNDISFETEKKVISLG